MLMSKGCPHQLPHDGTSGNVGLGELSPRHSMGLCVVELALHHELCSSLASHSGDLVLPLAWVTWERGHGGYVRTGPSPPLVNAAHGKAGPAPRSLVV